MKKLLLMFALLPVACLIAGLYGAAHNQISYTVCPEYFTKFKFYQFQLTLLHGENSELWNRLGASLIGWAASWWMGVPIGIVLLPAGLVIRGEAAYFWGMLRAFGWVVVTTMCVGLGALAFAYATIEPGEVGELVYYNNDITDDVAFARAGTMHNFSYLGGLLGIISGLISIFVQRHKQVREEHQQAILRAQ